MTQAGINCECTPAMHQECMAGVALRVSSLRIPWVTLVIALLALILSIPESLSSSFELKLPFTPTGAIQAICPLTAHLTHWDKNHLLWDLLTFTGLGIIAECYLVSSRRLALILLVCALAISAFAIVTPQEITSYRGLSGLCVALWVLLACGLWQRGSREIALVGLFFLATKISVEIATSSPLFAASANDSYQVFWQAHLIAALVTAGLGRRNQRETGTSQRISASNR